MARVVIDNVSQTYRPRAGAAVCAVRQVSLVVEDQELLVLVGPSGAGKSTLLRLIAGLEELNEGAIALDGQVLNSVPPRDRDMAMVFQNNALYPHLTAGENMALGLKLRRLPRPEIRQRIEQAAARLGLQDCLDRLPRALSGGERQRVALGRALVRRPKVFLFDEPLSNLDAPMRLQLRAELARLHERLRATMLYVTHDQAEAMTLGDRIAVMHEGRIQQVAPPMELYQRPANLFVARFLGTPPMNFLDGTVVPQNGAWFFAPTAPPSSSGALPLRLPDQTAHRFPQAAGKHLLLGIRPEDVQLLTAEAASAANLRVTIEVVAPLGAETQLWLASAWGSLVARTSAPESFQPGQELACRFAPSRFHFFDPATRQAIPSA